MFFFLFKEFYNQAYMKRDGKVAANGHIKQNGEIKQNGDVKQHEDVNKNGIKNGSMKNGASKYYMNGVSEVNHRIKSQ